MSPLNLLHIVKKPIPRVQYILLKHLSASLIMIKLNKLHSFENIGQSLFRVWKEHVHRKWHFQQKKVLIIIFIRFIKSLIRNMVIFVLSNTSVSWLYTIFIRNLRIRNHFRFKAHNRESSHHTETLQIPCDPWFIITQEIMKITPRVL